MKKVLLLIAVLWAVHSVAYAQLLGRSVEFGDLAQLSTNGVEALKETEFEVFRANVRVAAAKALENQAKSELKKAESNLESARLNVKAVKAEYKAAEANQEKERMDKAEKDLKKALETVNLAEMLVKWKSKEVDAQKTAVKKSDLALDLAEVKRDMARVNQLVAEKVPAANKYPASDYERKMKKIQENHKKASDKEKRESLEAEQLKSQYEKMAKT